MRVLVTSSKRRFSSLALLSTLGLLVCFVPAYADQFQALRAQNKAVCQSNCMNAEGMVFLSQGGPFTGPNAVQKCYSTCECIDASVPGMFSEADFTAYVLEHSPNVAARYDQLVQSCVARYR